MKYYPSAIDKVIDSVYRSGTTYMLVLHGTECYIVDDSNNFVHCGYSLEWCKSWMNSLR